MAQGDGIALASITARALAIVAQETANRLPLTSDQGQAVKRSVYVVSALLAPAITNAADVSSIGGALAGIAASLQSSALPQDAAPVFYAAAQASSAAVPAFASPARLREARLGRLLAECLEATWLGNAFVSEAQTDFGDRQSAIAARKRIAAAMDGALDRIAAADAGETVIGILGSVARTASDHIATVAANLRPIVRVQTPRSVPSTALAFALYGDPSLAPELVARNRVATSLFMPTTLDALAPGA